MGKANRSHVATLLMLSALSAACVGMPGACNAISLPAPDRPSGSSDDPPGSDTPPPDLDNSPPRAVIGDDIEVLAGDVVVFDARDSSDPDGEIVAYRWEFGDGSAAADPTVDHVYGVPGRFDATLTVTDDQGAVDTDSIVVTVLDAQPVRQVTLTVNVEPREGGSVTVDPPGGVYDAGDLVTLTAEPASGYEFVGFQGDARGSFGVTEILMDGDKEVVAVFDVIGVTVTGAIDPPGAGTTVFDPPGGSYEAGTTVTVSASPLPGFAFDALLDSSGDVLSTEPVFSFEALTDRQIVARFNAVTAPSTFTLSVSIAPPGAGAVTLDPPGGSYTSGTIVTVTALPLEGFSFVGFSGDHTGIGPTADLTIDGDKAVVAEFEWVPARGNPGNLLVTGFAGSNVTEFDRFDGRNLGALVASGAGGLSFAGGIDIGPGGDLFVVSIGVASDTAIIRYDAATGASLGTFVTGSSEVGFITLRFGPNGNLFVPNSESDTVEEYDGTTGEFVRTFVTSGSGGLENPVGLVFGPKGNLFVVSKNTDSILEYDGASGDAGGTAADLASFGFTLPVDLTFGPDGALYVTVSGDDGVVRVDVASGEAARFVSAGSGGLNAPWGLGFHPDTGNLLVVSSGTDAVLEYDGETGAFLGVFTTGSEGDSLLFMAFRPQ